MKLVDIPNNVLIYRSGKRVIAFERGQIHLTIFTLGVPGRRILLHPISELPSFIWDSLRGEK